MEFLTGVLVFLAAFAVLLVYLTAREHRLSVDRLVRVFDSRERELLDRLMWSTSTGKPWNRPERVVAKPEEAPEEVHDYQWKEF